MSEQRDFIYFESPQVPLKEVPYGDLKANIIDPTTGKPYKGIVLEGIFAQFSNTPNNNNRIYDIPEYLKLLEQLKKQVLSSKGVYGELEHPEKYSVDFNNISHKILDVWYDPATLCVMGRVLLINTPKGKIAQEVIKSGGQLAISARAAGAEIKQPDGTFKAVTRLLTTYDLVYHPGFSSAVLEFKELNESQQFIQNAGNNKQGYSFKVYRNQLGKISDIYAKYISLNESAEVILDKRSKCFQEYLFESIQDTEQQEMLEEGDVEQQHQKQQKLQKAVKQQKQKQLKEAKVNKLMEDMFFQQRDIYQKRLKNKADKAFYDNSAGFVTNNNVINTEINN